MNKPPVFTFITNPKAFMVHPTWEEIEPYFRELSNHTLTSASVYPWLAAWSELSRLVD